MAANPLGVAFSVAVDCGPFFPPLSVRSPVGTFFSEKASRVKRLISPLGTGENSKRIDGAAAVSLNLIDSKRLFQELGLN